MAPRSEAGPLSVVTVIVAACALRLHKPISSALAAAAVVLERLQINMVASHRGSDEPNQKRNGARDRSGQALKCAETADRYWYRSAPRMMAVRIARLLKWPPGEASIIGWLLQTKAFIMIIFANVLLDRGIITAKAFTALVLMAVESTMRTLPVVVPKLRRIARPATRN